MDTHQKSTKKGQSNLALETWPCSNQVKRYGAFKDTPKCKCSIVDNENEYAHLHNVDYVTDIYSMQSTVGNESTHVMFIDSHLLFLGGE